MAVVAFARHFGCPFCLELAAQLNRDLLPQLKELDVKLFLVGIGPRENALKMVESSGFPAEFLFGDNDGECYKALDTYEGLGRTFLNMKSTTVLMERFFKD